MLMRIVRGVMARLEVIGIDAPEFIHGQERYPRALTFQKPARFNNRRMLDLRGDNVVTTVAPRKIHAFERKIVGLASAAGEDDFVILTAEQSRNLPTRFFKGGFCRRRSPMPARRVAEVIRKKRRHCRCDRRIDRRAGVVVEIDALRGHVAVTLLVAAEAVRRSLATSAGASNNRAPRKPPAPIESAARIEPSDNVESPVSPGRPYSPWRTRRPYPSRRLHLTDE